MDLFIHISDKYRISKTDKRVYKDDGLLSHVLQDAQAEAC